MIASLPSAETSYFPASQYFAMRSLTPAAAAQLDAVFLGHSTRATAAKFLVQWIAPRGNRLPSFLIASADALCNDSDMTQPPRYAHTQKQNLCLGPAAPPYPRRDAGRLPQLDKPARNPPKTPCQENIPRLGGMSGDYHHYAHGIGRIPSRWTRIDLRLQRYWDTVGHLG